jgi:hypothetical protein
MFSLDVIDTDAFLEMPSSTQNLYFHLCLRADDDGFVSAPRKIIRTVNASDDEMRVLFSKAFVIPFDSGVCVIRHWRMQNYIQADRYHETIYLEEKNRLTETEGVYNLDTPCIHPVSKAISEVRLELGKDRDRDKKENAANAAPSFEVTKVFEPGDEVSLSDAPPPAKKGIREETPPEAARLASLLFSLHKSALDPKYSVKSKQLENWAADIEKIHRIDGRSWEEIEATIRWVKTPGQFWAANVMSGATLRDRFARLVADKQRAPAPRVASQSTMLEMEG